MAAGSDSPFYLKNERLIDVDPILQGDFVYHCHDPLQFAYKIMIGGHGNFEGPGNFQGPKLLTAPGIFQAAWKFPGPGNFKAPWIIPGSWIFPGPLENSRGVLISGQTRCAPIAEQAWQGKVVQKGDFQKRWPR